MFSWDAQEDSDVLCAAWHQCSCPPLRDLLLRAIYSLLDTMGTTAGLTAHCVFSLHLKVPVLQRCDRN